MDITDFLNRYRGGSRSFPWVDLTGADLSDTSLVGTHFNRAKLSEVCFVNSDLSQVDFTYADLRWADLRGATLTGVKFRKANLQEALIDLTQIPPQSLLGATLPDGTQHPLVLETPADLDPPRSETPRSELTAPMAGAVANPEAAANPGQDTPSDSPAPGNAGVLPTPPIAQFHTVAPPPPLPPPPLPPTTWAELRRVLPWTPLGMWVVALNLMGILWLLAGGSLGGLGVMVAIALILPWKKIVPMGFNSGSWIAFAPVGIGIALLVDSPMTTLFWGSLGLALTFSTFFGLWIAGWTARKALRDCCWLGGLATLVLLLFSWLPATSPSGVPGILLIPLFIIMLWTMFIGLNYLEAMAIAGIRQYQIQGINTALVLGSAFLPAILPSL